MTTIDSRFEIELGDTPVYVTSESKEGYLCWGQPPASHYFFLPMGTTLRGQLISGNASPMHISSTSDYGPVLTPDPQDALMDDAEALRKMYAEFAEEDQLLAQTGLAHYAQMLRQEESQA